MNKVLKVAALGAAVVVLSTSAFAAPQEGDLQLNIYGASAQGTFWNTYAKSFLQASTDDGGMGCARYVEGKATAIAQDMVGILPATLDLTKLGITVGIACEAANGKNVYIRYTSNKSVEGPRAVMNQDPQNNDACPLVGGVDKNRAQADWNNNESSPVFTATCLDVNVGASDVASEAFTQQSSGNKNGTYTTTPYSEALDPATIPGLDQIGTAANPVIVPFAFFANNALSSNDFTRQQMLLIMSGNVYNWSQFGPGYDDKKVVLCMRHAGSGTHATLDKAIMRDDAALPVIQALAVPYSTKKAGVLFHESSSDMMKCINDNGKYDTATTAAIGYADADAIVASYSNGNEVKKSSAANVKRLKFNGTSEGMTAANFGTYGWSQMKNNIINGSYEFWASQWMYINADQEGEDTMDLYTKLTEYAANTTLPCPGLGCYWSTASQLHVSKSDDFAIPTLNGWK